MKRNAFTLVELLAVIGILAVILTITIPIIGNYIKDKNKDSFFISAKNILRHVEAEGLYDNEINARLNMLNLTDLKEENYDIEGSYVYTKDGELHLTLKGKGKFKGLYICGLTSSIKENNVVETECSDDSFKVNLADYITRLYNNEETRTSNGLKKDNTEDENIRYYGSDPNNYVSFNNELWRIIGVFGNNVKLVRKDSLGELSWDSSDSTINSGNGINQWGESTYEDGSLYEGADLQVYLNKMYYGGTSVTCYNGKNNQTTTCPTGTIDETSKSLIDYHIWNTGAIEYNTRTDTLAFYSAERGTTNGKICTSGTYCNDTVTRTTEWTGYIGLPYVTDWAYASSESVCETNMQKQDSSNAYICKNNNWMQGSKWAYYFSPYAHGTFAGNAWSVSGAGYANRTYAASSRAVAPSIYLKSNVIIESGKGTSTDPYILSGN